MNFSQGWIVPAWPAPPCVGTLVTTRHGGVSQSPYDSLNLGAHVGDNPVHVAENRRRLTSCLPRPPVWLSQVHGTDIVAAEAASNAARADGTVTSRTELPCAILVADCLPVLFCNTAGSRIGAAHAGWRGLSAGVLEQTVKAMNTDPEQLLVFLGPAIGPRAFEVGSEVRDVFIADDASANSAFRPAAVGGKYFANLYALAKLRLMRMGVTHIYGEEMCTVSDSARFFSYRRDGVTGRMAAVIWLKA